MTIFVLIVFLPGKPPALSFSTPTPVMHIRIGEGNLIEAVLPILFSGVCGLAHVVEHVSLSSALAGLIAGAAPRAPAGVPVPC